MGRVTKHVDWAEIVKQAIASEREACAKIAQDCEDPWAPRYVDMSIGFQDAREKIADQIRARGEQ